MERVRLKPKRVRLCAREVIRHRRVVRFANPGRALAEAQEHARLMGKRLTRIDTIEPGEDALRIIQRRSREYGEVYVVRMDDPLRYDVYITD